MKSGITLTLAGLVFFSGLAQAAQLSSSCYAPINSPDKVVGENLNQKIPIASVSKLVTSYWAVKAKGINYRFQTVVYLTPVAPDTYDLHFQGSRDPYLGAEQLHYMISELNKRGIKKIRNLTYDKNFKFFWFGDDPESNRQVAVGFYVPADPNPDTVESQLKAYKKLVQGYDETYEKAHKRGVEMVENPEFSVETISYLDSEDFKPTAKSRAYTVNSVKLESLLKEMNRNSNNHAANQIFEHLGSASRFTGFLEKSLGLKSDAITMLNGSGDRVDTPKGALYNSASCAAMLKILLDFNKTLLEQNSSITKVATVVGVNGGSATNLYNSDMTKGAVAAKTGTVNPAVTLAGIIATKQGPYVFMINVNPQGSFSGGRAIIRNKLNEMIRELGGKGALKAENFSFLSFDKQSFADLIPSGKLP